MDTWKEKTLAHWGLINSMAEKRFSGVSIAEEAVVFVIDGLKQDDWRRVKTFAGKSSFPTFLRSVVYRLLEDFSRKKYGRVEPPRWLKALGGVWLLLFRLLCLERLALGDAVEKSSLILTQEKRREIETAAHDILEKVPNCRSRRGFEVDMEKAKYDISCHETTPEIVLDRSQRRELFSLVFANITLEQSDADDKRLGKMGNITLTLSAQERLLLKMKYVDGFSTREICAMLNLRRNQVNGRLRRLMARLRGDLQDCGMAREILLHLGIEDDTN